MVDIHVGTGIVLTVVSVFSIIGSIVNDYLNNEEIKNVDIIYEILGISL